MAGSEVVIPFAASCPENNINPESDGGGRSLFSTV